MTKDDSRLLTCIVNSFRYKLPISFSET